MNQSPPPINLGPAQTARVVYGLRGFDGAHCAIDRDVALSAMDAPMFLPAGSLLAYEIHGGRKVLMERLTMRGKPAYQTALQGHD